MHRIGKSTPGPAAHINNLNNSTIFSTYYQFQKGKWQLVQVRLRSLMKAHIHFSGWDKKMKRIDDKEQACEKIKGSYQGHVYAMISGRVYAG